MGYSGTIYTIFATFVQIHNYSKIKNSFKFFKISKGLCISKHFLSEKEDSGLKLYTKNIF